MNTLSQEKCTVCAVGAQAMEEMEVERLRAEIPAWQIVERDGFKRLERIFTFNNFAEAMEFTNRIAALAEAEGHHPAILTEWGRVTVSWWTHKIRGLHRNDFLMAARTDLIAAPATVEI